MIEFINTKLQTDAEYSVENRYMYNCFNVLNILYLLNNMRLKPTVAVQNKINQR